MKRAVITGLGIISSIGNNKQEVLASLQEGRSGITFSQELKDAGMRSHVWGDVKLDTKGRTDRSLSRLEAMLAVANKDASLIITGNGDVVEPENGLIAMGSGGGYAQAAASALLKKTDLSAREIVETALGIAGDICVFTNHNLTIEEQDLAE